MFDSDELIEAQGVRCLWIGPGCLNQLEFGGRFDDGGEMQLEDK